MGASDDDREGGAVAPTGIRRRTLFGAAGAGALAVGAGAGYLARGSADAAEHPVADPDAVPVDFAGEHQAGVTTPAQDRLHFAAFDVITDSRDDLVSLLQDWTDAARDMTAGNEVGKFGAVAGPPVVPPEDTGEALGLPASQLTLTIGFGRTLFAKDGKDRFGLADRRPEQLVDLPHFSGDRLEPAICGGDIAIQACANDPQVAVHAIRNLARIAFGRASVRYSQLGFGRTSSTSEAQVTPRNLFGFKDGTANIKLEDTDTVEDFVWARSGDGPTWMDGGTYLVTRKIAMRIETWDRESLEGQQGIIGRAKGSGGPMSGGDEFEPLDFAANSRDGEPMIGEQSHVRLAHPDFNGGAKLLRRGYNFVDGSDQLGRLAAGLFFICYQRDPREQFVRIQNNLAGLTADLMNEYIVHIGSGIFACPPGVGSTGYWGESLFT
ncbi:iron uptake transporter deferrochelatase/peroxidase subunit [Solicola gregarius]|uniref:Deferrochelatase n=1 Tax=Solicola gregarius TaxID=2908642 RepID=A0AA46TEG9_9ACTN|nr:iron uptake transporter deferrochelatase/peroxidase subunit [Solicola gregarius]UYM03862.1 iron uptake transporter deferrochelatase/peroxidase subunit [Solicola gregarius]